MAPRIVHIKDLPSLAGETIGSSEWVLIDQDRVNKFAEATGDFQWIHVDVERAAKEMETGTTIAHGFLTLSLLPMLTSQIMSVDGVLRGINYGTNKVRFTNMVPVGSRVRATQTLKEANVRADGSVQSVNEVVIEIEGQDRPALVAETLGLVYPA
jgi:acyl dehydratase